MLHDLKVRYDNVEQFTLATLALHELANICNIHITGVNMKMYDMRWNKKLTLRGRFWTMICVLEM